MKLVVVGTGSTGNAYALISSTGEILLLEAGIHFKNVKPLIDFKVENIVGMLVTHKHGDHFNFINSFTQTAIEVYCSNGTVDGRHDKHIFNIIKAHETFNIGEFKVYAFDVRHDVLEPLGFYIYHPECGYIVFVTDSYMVDYKFPQVNHFIIEANYCENVVEELINNGSISEYRTDRLIKSHMSIQTCIKYLKMHDLKQVENIILIHLSDSNSIEKSFEKDISKLGFFNTHIASNKKIYDLNPF